jgi:hypothetical protein
MTEQVPARQQGGTRVNRDYREELLNAKQALAAKSATKRRNHASDQAEDPDAFQFLDRFRQFLLDNGSPGRGEIAIERPPDDPAAAGVRLGWRIATLGEGDQQDGGDTVLVLFSDRTEVAEAEYFHEFESCTVRWTSRAATGPPHSLSPKVIEGIAELLKTYHLDWDGG